MKKILVVTAIIGILFGLFVCTSRTYAAEGVIDNKAGVIDNQTESKIIQIKEESKKSLEDYKEKYGSDAYGFVAYVLNLIRIYSIPLCFLGIAISAAHHYIIGIRKLDTLAKGFIWMVSFITILIICQILPLAFAIIVKFGRG